MTNNAATPLLHTTKEYRKDLRKAWKDARQSLEEARVHDLRVAARRTGAALQLMESVLDADHAFKIRRKIRKVMKRMGALRDIQVQIGAVEKWKQSESVRKFLKSLKRAETGERRRVHAYLADHRRRSILDELRDVNRDAQKRLRKVSSSSLKAKVENSLTLRRMDLQVATEGLLESAPESLHALRTTARKLRYALEAAAGAMGAAPADELQRLRETQTQLGQKRDSQLLDAKFRKWKHKHSQG